MDVSCQPTPCCFRAKRLHHGRAVFRLPHLRTGTHRAKAIYLGQPRASAVRTFRVG